MWSEDYTISEAVGEPHDYWIREANPDPDAEPDEVERYRAWTAQDDEWTLIVSDSAAEGAFNRADERDDFTDVIWTSEAETEHVKEVDVDARERVAYYVDKPPETRYQDVRRDRAIELLERRELWDEDDIHVDSWYWPERDTVVVKYHKHGTHTSIDLLRELDRRDREILQGDHDESDEARRSPDEVAELIDEKAPIGSRESEILAFYIGGKTGHAEMAEELPVSRGSISSSAYALEAKLDEWVWLAMNVLSQVPDSELSDDLRRVKRALEGRGGDPYEYGEADVEGETTLR